VSTWRRCETCRKVLSQDAFDGTAQTCSGCANRPTKPARAARAGSVTTRHVPPASPVATAGSPAPAQSVRPRQQGVVGRGDPEVRSRRARALALQQLSQMHADDFERLLLDARRAEGLI